MTETLDGRLTGKKVLLIDNDIEYLASAARVFIQSGAKAITAVDGLEGIGKFFTHHPDLIILDVLLSGMDGFQVCRRIREFSKTPLIMLSDLDQDKHMLQGLQAGADDVLPKSVNPKVLSARAQALVRRNRQTDSGRIRHGYAAGSLVINFANHTVQIENREVSLTPVEFRLLTFLVKNAGRMLTFEQILFNVWGSKDCRRDYVHVYISQLRRKIEQDPKNPRYILSVPGEGYLFERQTDAATASPGTNGKG